MSDPQRFVQGCHAVGQLGGREVLRHHAMIH
ncbi:hypothetical protein QBD01_005169, partial [Ochrobactrum sp. 19YEA23]|nr:hypothetical protein [Ochrobactrum sp. 19YEA23]